MHVAFADQPDPSESWEDRWGTPEKGLVTSWLRGIEMRHADNPAADAAAAGELPVLPWVGGCAKRLKNIYKLGSLNYLAMWQGLRHQDLSIDLELGATLECSRTGMIVTFTGDSSKLFSAASEEG
ncbi:hypothetical protein [Variovorax paradoxus]|uniref:hypothetical protein n=1 Tax=Variovorax paradoxus TaxID=34073 RepID=UPI001933F77B|nr:hypothetical protein INQ48_20605 [Variovorax paradoxus]